MKRLLPFLFLLLFSVSSFAQTNYSRKKVFKLSAATSSRDYIGGSVIVKFKEKASGAKTLSSVPSLTLRSAVMTSLTQKFPAGLSKDKSAVSKEVDRIGLSRIYELKYSGEAGIETVVNELLKDGDVEYAEPNYIAHVNYTPNDPYYSMAQNYLEQVKASLAWNVLTNSGGIVIGIVDTGSDLTHEDLSSSIIGGIDLIGASAASPRQDDNPGVTRPLNDHGVHVSGLAAALSNNNKGIASISSNAKLLIVKVAADDNAEDIYYGYDGIKYAVDNGANIVNCSWGSQERSLYGEDVVNYAISKGSLIVAAAGNHNVSTPDYPAGYKGVMAVANVGASDRKAGTSNFGGFVSISAPGEGIFSTRFPNTYGYLSGTSMATPIVSSAAALVKSYRTDLSMQQIGELLRVTADDIDDQNEAYAQRLGKGRLNVFRALTENTSPAVRSQNIITRDDNSGSFMAGSTFSIYLELKNYLAPSMGLKVSLKSDNPYVSVQGGAVNVGSLRTLESKSMIGPFLVSVNSGTPDNSPVEFRIEYSDEESSYHDYENFTLAVALDYMNITTENLATTVTSNGRIGFSSNDQSGGLGFQYKGNQLLYEASLMIASKAEGLKVSDNARVSEFSGNEHFIKRRAVKEVSTDSTIAGISEFDDSANSDGLRIDVKHSLTAQKDPDESKFVVAEYEVINRNPGALNGVYIGLFNDWDVDNADFNGTAYDALTRIAYAYSTNNSSAPFVGVKYLSSEGTPSYYPLSNGSGILNDGNFTDEEKFETLSSGIKSAGTGISGADISFVSGYGPFTIPANGSVKVAFAYGAGDNLDDLRAALGKAQASYNGKNNALASSATLYSYPNPVTSSYNNNVAAVVNLPDNAVVSLDLFNLLGQKVKTFLKDTSLEKGSHTLYYNFADLGSGIYLMRLRYNNVVKTHKISVVR